MPAQGMLVDQRIRAKLGEDGLTRVAGCLHPVDCQSCGRALGSAPPALAVDDLGPMTQASPHHSGCRASEWSQTGVLDGRMMHAEHTSWRAKSVLLNINVPGKEAERPADRQPGAGGRRTARG